MVPRVATIGAIFGQQFHGFEAMSDPDRGG